MTYSYRFYDGLCSLVFICILVLWSSAGEKLIHHFLRVAQFFQFVQFIDLFLLRFCLVFMEFIFKSILLRRFFILGCKNRFTQDIINIIINDIVININITLE